MRGHVQFSREQREDSCNEKDALSAALPPTRERGTVKRHRGEPGHTRDTRDTRAHAGTRITQTNLTTIHPNPTTHPHDHATAETAADSTAARTAAGARTSRPDDRSPRPTQKRPPQTLPPPPSLPRRLLHTLILPPFFQLFGGEQQGAATCPDAGLLFL